MMKKLLKVTEIDALPKSVKFPNYQIYRSQVLIELIEDLNEDCVKISHPVFYTFREKNRQRGGSGRFTILKDSAGPEMFIKIDLHFIRFF